MAKTPNHWCRTCGVEFYGCDACPETSLYQPWRTLCCSQQHYQVYMIFCMHRDGVMNESEVRDSLNQINITVDEIKTFIPAIQDVLLPIMETERKFTKKVKITTD